MKLYKRNSVNYTSIGMVKKPNQMMGDVVQTIWVKVVLYNEKMLKFVK